MALSVDLAEPAAKIATIPPSLPMIETLQTERLVGERIRPEDREDLLMMHSDPRVMVTLGGIRSTAESDRFLNESLEHWNRHGFGLWVFREPDRGRYVGRAGLRHVEVGGAHEIELAYALMADYWGCGLATELGRTLLKLAFGPLGMGQVVCFTLTSNRASQRVMEKLGFTFEREIIHLGFPHVLFRIQVTDSNTDSHKS